MDDFCQIVSCHTTGLYASMGFSNSQKGYFQRVNGIDDGDGDILLDSHERSTSSRPCQHSQSLNSSSCHNIPDDTQHNSQWPQYEEGIQHILFVIDNHSFKKKKKKKLP